MGQQQLLLLVLGIVIVGLAVVAGINAFDENQTKSSQDALTNEAFRLASDAKAWYNKPDQYNGGGSDPTKLANITWEKLGVNTTASINGNGDYVTPWGTIKMTGADGEVTFEMTTNQGDGTAFGTVVFDEDATAGQQITLSGS